MNISESILDFPKETLCPAIWQKKIDGTFELTINATMAIQNVVNWVV